MSIIEPAFLEQVLEARRARPGSSTWSSSTATRPTGRSLERGRGRRPGFDFEAAGAAVAARGPPHPDLHLRHHRAAQGRPAHPPQPHGRGRGGRGARSSPGRRRGSISWLPTAHVAERSAHHYLPIVCGLTVTGCPNPRDIVAYLPDGAADLVLRRAAHLGEAQGRRSRRCSPAEPDEQRARPRRRRSTRRCRRCASSRRASRARGARGGSRARPTRSCSSKLREQLGPRPGVAVNVGAAPTPLEVLEFFHAIGIAIARAVGHVGDLRRGTMQPARPGQARHRRPALPGRRDQAGGRRRGARARADRHAGLPQPAREDRARRSTRTAGCTRATSASSTTTATCGSSTARRRSSSTPPARTCRRPTSRRR